MYIFIYVFSVLHNDSLHICILCKNGYDYLRLAAANRCEGRAQGEYNTRAV